MPPTNSLSTPARRPFAIAFALCCVAVALFAVMDTVMKGLSLSIGLFNALFWRSLAGTVLGVSLMLLTRQRWPSTPVLRLHLLRGAVVTVMASLFFWGIMRMPLAEAIALSFIAPLVALYLAALLLKEKVGRRAVGASLLGLVGVAVILSGRMSGDYGADALPGAVAVLLSALLFAWNLILQRQQAQLASPVEIAFFQHLVMLGLFSAAALVSWLAPSPLLALLGQPGLAVAGLAAGLIVPQPQAWLLILLATVLAFTSLAAFAWAYARAEAQYLIPVEYSAFIWAAILGWLIFGERLTFATVAGAALIIAGCLIAAYGDRGGKPGRRGKTSRSAGLLTGTPRSAHCAKPEHLGDIQAMAVSRGAKRTPEWREMLKRSLIRSGALISAITLMLATLFLALALLSFRLSDPSMMTVADNHVQNIMGLPGAWISALLLTLLGVPVALILPLLAITARRLWGDQDMADWKAQFGKCLLGIAMVSIGLAMFQPDSLIDLPSGWGGLVGLATASGVRSLTAQAPAAQGWITGILIVLMLISGFFIWYRSLALEKPIIALRRPTLPQLNLPRPSFALTGSASVAAQSDADDDDDVEDRVIAPRRAVTSEPKLPINIQTPRPAPAQRQMAPVSQDDLFGNSSLPSADLLNPIPASQGQKIDKAALERNARLLESVLDDFHVKGNIVEVRPGPVVTMYELEPAPGIKASRVIALADDIARNMSALSARVATIPGRTVIGIELPNANREGVSFRELVTSEQFGQDATLPIILGKNISGEPIIADLAPMPHLLIAGTTGSGKSVGLNAMILSLLYRMTPDQLRLIMIDPKMLELSTYDDIPHLLSPVVTEPNKAIRALKWAVEQMEDRYRMMASISVRNLANYNEKVRAAKAKGKPLGRRVQTGYDPETGKPIYEEEQLDFQPLPQIVVVVDELADLMMTAGKEVEFLIQRLAQKARAAGIHLILATQRPSVDVITGVIKANLPTRISFFVTSKIDSRTILGEQGAEQLLGKGDMLYMHGGKGLMRVHGPFVSDDEVRLVADHWRAQGQPDYIAAVTEEPEEGSFALDGVDLGDDSPDAQLFRKACQLVFENQKASTSWLQRQLRIGYNSAARLIERMEEEGLVGPPNHVGRREVLRDENGSPL